MRRAVLGGLKRTAATLALILLGGFLTLLVGFVLLVNGKPDLKPWHTVVLEEEFTERSSVDTLEGYLALEERLFAQLEERVFERIAPGDRRSTNRYHRGSRSDPGRWPRDWNRTFELAVQQPRAGVLLLHGMSDSPYSLRRVGERLHAADAWVVGLRLPGHGTAPAGLARVRWQDMATAVELALRHLHARCAGRPLYVVGYSNGGALAIHYASRTLEETLLPPVDGLVLISPAIGIAPVAALAVWQERLGAWLGLSKLGWTDVLPEYDPFKYQSFAVNAANQTHLLTLEIERRLTRLGEGGAIAGFPPVLALQSAVDATVSTPALITGLMERLPGPGHELVLFDVNRTTELEYLLRDDPGPRLTALLDSGELGFTLSVVANVSEESDAVAAYLLRPGRSEPVVTPLGLSWPPDVFSLSHVSLHYPPDDPLYGRWSGEEGPLIHLGGVALRGERGALSVPAADMLRQRWNPFYAWLERRILAFTGLDASGG